MFDDQASTRLPPSAKDAALARESVRSLSALTARDSSVMVTVCTKGRDQGVEIPAGAVALLVDILENMAAGRGVSLVPQKAELTTVQAASMLNVSRPFLIKMLNEGIIPFHKTGTHRRVRIEDVMAYKARIDQAREATLDALVADAQANGMGYDV